MNKLFRRTFFYTLFVSLGLLVFSCKSKFEQLRTSTDLALKYKEAVKFYESGQYAKAYILFEDLVKVYRGRENADQLYYYYANTVFKQKDYISARYHYKNLADTYPNSVYTEEARYMAGYTYYLTSPKYTLDQADTYRAIDNLNYFIEQYPKSDLVEKCKTYIAKLEDKLQKKSLKIAQLYYDMGNYKASSVAYKNTLLDFPDSKYAEEIFFKAYESQVLYAEKSYLFLQKERFEDALSMFNDFSYRFPDSPHMEEAKKLKALAENKLATLPESNENSEKKSTKL